MKAKESQGAAACSSYASDVCRARCGLLPRPRLESSLLEVRLSGEDVALRLPPELIRQAIIEDDRWGPQVRVGTPGTTLKPLTEQQQLVPFDRMADRAVALYQQPGNESRLHALCKRYLELAGASLAVPGRAIVHILLYFTERDLDHVQAMQHLLCALALAAADSCAAPWCPMVLNDLGVLMLLKCRRPVEAVRLFEAAVRTGYSRTNAGLFNLRLIEQTCRRERIEIPELREALRAAEAHAAEFRGHFLKNGPPAHRRPHPTRENWSWYLDPKELTLNKLDVPRSDDPEGALAASLFIEALSFGDSHERASRLTVAAGVVSEFQPFAINEQRRLVAELNALVRNRQHQAFLVAASRAIRGMAIGEWDEAAAAVRQMANEVKTDLQKRLAEILAAEVAAFRPVGPASETVSGSTQA